MAWKKIAVALAAPLALASCSSDESGSADGATSTAETSATSEETTTVDPTPSTEGETTTSTEATSSSEVSSTTATPPSSTTSTSTGQTQTGVVNVGLEPVGGYFIEGFEVGLRFETDSGEVIDSTLWSDFVAGLGQPGLDSYYQSVLAQTVPAGKIVVLATANIGLGPGPVIPDPSGDLRCRLVVDVEAGAEVNVEITFDSQTDCLRLR